MAASDSEKVAIIQSLRSVTKTLIDLQGTASKVLAQNSSQSITWTDEDPNALDSTFEMSGTEISNAIGSLSDLATTWWGTNGVNFHLIVSDRPIT